MQSCMPLRTLFNPIALRKAKIEYNFGLSECSRVKQHLRIEICWQINYSFLCLFQWPVSTIKEQLNKLRTCCVRDGSTYIYCLWKSLLHSWFSDPDSKVYLVTPFLDASRLAEICQIILQHKNEASLAAFYVRQQCDRERKIHEVKQDALKLFKDANDQMFIEYKIFPNIIYPMKRFHAKFMACVKSDEAQVVVTSANFHGDHFEHSNMETVQFLTMSEAKFLKDILGPINSSVKVQK